MRHTVRLAALMLATTVLAGCSSLDGVGGFLGGGGSQPDDTKLNDQGYAAMQAGNMGEAENLLREALVANPDNPYAMLNLGVLMQNTGRPALARQAYQRLINADDAALATMVGGDPQEAASLKILAERNLALLPEDEIKRREAERMAREKEAAEAEQMRLAKEERAAADAAARAAEMEAQAAEKKTGMTASEKSGDENSAMGGWRVHLASYRDEGNAEKGWTVLAKKHAKQLGERSHDIVRANLGAEKGIYFRVFAVGYPTKADARQSCAAIKSGGDYCKVFEPVK